MHCKDYVLVYVPVRNRGAIGVRVPGAKAMRATGVYLDGEW